ncbi:MAG TPA: PQQ-binding-like beta-propeller repeat protein [Verrucomicrobiae bacterium]|nr:PQQ-binding-like beta-propeller repeat protein [Verrucomicrobiae bacterium]
MSTFLPRPLILAAGLMGAIGASAQPVPGTVLWTYDAGTAISSSPAITPDGAICFGTTTALTAITNAGTTASNKWTFPVGQGVTSSPAVAADGTVYFLASGLGCYALNPDGSTKWSYAFQSTGLSSPAIGADGTIYIVGDSSLYALTPAGAKKWASPVNGQSGSPVVSSDGTVYFTSFAGSLYAFNPDGTPRWSYSIQNNSGMGDSAAIGSDGTVYITQGPLFAFAPNGTNLWQTPAQSSDDFFAKSSPVVAADGTIYVVNGASGNLAAVSPSGRVLWRVPLSVTGYSPPTTVPAVDAAGMIYYCVSNAVWAVSSQGQIQWVVNYPAMPPIGGYYAATSPVVGPDGTIYAALGSKLYAIAGTNTLGSAPWPMCRQNPRHTGKLEKPALGRPQKRTDANFQFELYPQQLGLTYAIESSTNLNTWTSLTSFVATSLPMPVTDLSASNSPSKFYRAFSSP